MASGALPSGVDFNDPANLDLYFQIRSFKNDLSTGELLLERRSRTEQLKIHTIAQSFDLEYEYSVGTRVVRISRTVSHEAQIFAPEATIDNIHENLPHWEHLHGSFGQDFSDFSNFDSGIASRGADGETPEAHAIPNNQDSLADMALPPFDLSQSMNFLSQPVPSMLAASTQSNLAQEIDELLSNAHSVRQEQQEPLFEDPAINSAIIDEFEHPSEKKKSQRVPSPSSPYQWGDIRRPAAAGRSGSAHSDASGISGVSGRSGRTGPLSDLARAGMKAVKKVGACWRCVFLRKKCDPEDPCLICPKGGKSSWEALGCHRGDFKTRMLPIRICPVESSDPVQVIAEDNSYWLDNQVRVSWVENDDRVEVTDDETLHKEEVRRLFLEEIKDKWELLCKPPDQAVLQSLQSYTMDVVWELLETPSSLSLLSEEGTFDSLLRILPTAAVYQANVENDRLIAQSLICLRSCLEVLRLQASDTRVITHSYCNNLSSCRVKCIKSLGINITLYLDELAKVFFKKDNRRNKGLSWLSTFYSFCIQSLVRTALLEITKIRTIIGTCTTDPAATQYLYLPLRLFIASNSGPKDPLFSDENSEIESPGFEDYKQAREAVNYAHWSSTGIQNSGEYLKRLFQDDGNALDFTPAKAQATPAIDNEGEDMGSLKRQRLNLFKCNQCRDARKKCYPVDRKWPQKCDRCIAHRPEALECSEPALNTRKRGRVLPRNPKPPTPSKYGAPTTYGNSFSRESTDESMASRSSLRNEITNWSD